MHDAGVAASQKSQRPTLLAQQIQCLGPLRFALLFTLGFGSAVWLVVNMLNGLWWTPPGLVNAEGGHIGRDFVAFWSAAHLALTGAPASAYDHVVMHGVQLKTIGAPVPFTPWFYPPFVQELLAPLAILPYPAALAVWVLLPLAGLIVVMRRLFSPWSASAVTVIFPGTAQNLLIAQNGVLSTFIIAGGLQQLERNPFLAGAILGTLSYKPHIAAAVYAALLFGGYWRSLGAAFVVTAVLAGASVVAFGIAPWLAFLQESHTARTALEDGILPWALMTTVFAAARLSGLDVYMSYALQAAVAFGAYAALFCVWRRSNSSGARAAILCAVIPLTTPYAYCYDLAVLLLPLFWLIESGLQTGFRRSEVLILALVWVIPPVGWLIAREWHVLFTPLILILFAAVVLRRALAEENSVIHKPVQLFDPRILGLQETTEQARA